MVAFKKGAIIHNSCYDVQVRFEHERHESVESFVECQMENHRPEEASRLQLSKLVVFVYIVENLVTYLERKRKQVGSTLTRLENANDRKCLKSITP